jgi:hypothetical protein
VSSLDLLDKKAFELTNNANRIIIAHRDPFWIPAFFEAWQHDYCHFTAKKLKVLQSQ